MAPRNHLKACLPQAKGNDFENQLKIAQARHDMLFPFTLAFFESPVSNEIGTIYAHIQDTPPSAKVLYYEIWN
jgi:hypothetical protein